MESYTIGRDQFGMEKEFIVEVVQNCPNPACRYYKNQLEMTQKSIQQHLSQQPTYIPGKGVIFYCYISSLLNLFVFINLMKKSYMCDVNVCLWYCTFCTNRPILMRLFYVRSSFFSIALSYV